MSDEEAVLYIGRYAVRAAFPCSRCVGTETVPFFLFDVHRDGLRPDPPVVHACRLARDGPLQCEPPFFGRAGTGVSFYEKALVPLFADVKFLLTRRRRFTPYAGCAAGYAFALRGDANGGLLLNPELGVQYALRCGMHLFLGAGYELQRLERLRKYRGSWFSAEFAEKFSHGTLLLKVGVLF